MYIANLTGEISSLLPQYQKAKEGGAVMLNGFFTGFSALRHLRQHAEVPIMGHFAGMALYDRTPGFGIDGVVMVKLERLAGCDMIGLPGFGDRMHTTDTEVKRNISACLEPMGAIKPAMPIPGGSDSAETLAGVCQKVGHTDFGFIAGRGVFGHPQGPRAGAQSLVSAWGENGGEKRKKRRAFPKCISPI